MERSARQGMGQVQNGRLPLLLLKTDKSLFVFNQHCRLCILRWRVINGCDDTAPIKFTAHLQQVRLTASHTSACDKSTRYVRC